MEQNALFRKRYGSFRRFFAMLGKARLPYLWIVGYLAVSAFIANVSVSTTEYSAALFAGQVGLFAVVLPYLFFYAAIAGDRLHFQPDKQPVPGADRPEPAADGVEKGRASAAAIL